MARIRKTVFWATRAVALLISFLFSAVQLAPPAWAKAVGDPRSDAAGGVALTALIADFSRSDGFDRRLGDELDRLEGAGGAGEGSAARARPMERFAQTQQPQQTFQELAPLPKVLPQQAPKGQPQQAAKIAPAQRQQAYITDDWSGKPRSLPAKPQQQQTPGRAGQPQQAIINPCVHTPRGVPATPQQPQMTPKGRK